MAPSHLHYVIFVEGLERRKGSVQHGQGLVEVPLGIVSNGLRLLCFYGSLIFHLLHHNLCFIGNLKEGGREGGREGRREGGRQGGREGGREGREGGREGERGGREGREGGREGERGGREGGRG